MGFPDFRPALPKIDTTGAVIVDGDGVVVTPSNFVEANNLTTQGNTFNAANELPKSDANNIIPYDKGTIGLTGCAFCFEGDSITYGYGLPSPTTQCFASLFSNDKFALNHGTLHNSAVSGSWIAAGSNGGNNITDRFTPDVYPHRPTANGGDGGPQAWLFVGGGINDLRGAGGGTPQTATQIISALTTYTTAALAAGFTVVLEDILPASGLSGPVEIYRQQINKAVRSGGIPCSFAWQREYVLPDYADGTFYQDGTHPTIEGHKLLEQDLESKMQIGAFAILSGTVFFSSQTTFNNPPKIWNTLVLSRADDSGSFVNYQSSGVDKWWAGSQGTADGSNWYVSDQGLHIALAVTGWNTAGTGYGLQLNGQIFQINASSGTGQAGMDIKSNGTDRWFVGSDDSNGHRFLIWDRGNGNTPMFLTGWNTSAYALHVQGSINANQINGTSAVPTIAYGTGAGASPATISITGSSLAFKVSFTSGTGCAANSTIFTLTLPYSATSLHVGISARNKIAAYNMGVVFVTTTGNTIVLNSTDSAIADSVEYDFDFVVIGA